MTVPLPLLDASGDLGPEADLARMPPVPVPDGPPRPAPAERGAVWAAVAVLAAYPDDRLAAALPDVDAALDAVTPAVGGAATGPLRALVAHLRERPLLGAQQDYVATFDTRRRCCPYLTYYLHGDTRRRGLALWRVTAALAACGLEPAHGELGDHLAVLAELAATGDESVAVALLGEHRTGLALLGAALAAVRSPYAGLVDAVEALLPPEPAPAAAASRAAAARIAESGPPAETVGLPGRLTPFLPAGRAGDGADDRGARR